MFENISFSLNGYGYLHEVEYSDDDKSCATLNLICEFNDSQSDDVWLECHFNTSKFPIFHKLRKSLIEGRPIILKFCAKYSGFEQYYAGVTTSDPRFIVQLRGELLNVQECHEEAFHSLYRDNCRMKSEKALRKLRAGSKWDIFYK